MKKSLMPAVSTAALFACAPAAVLGNPRAEAPNIEQTLKEVTAQLSRIESSVKSTAEDALAQAKKAGEVSAETKAEADKLLTAQTEATKIVEGLKAQLESLDTKTADIAQAVADGFGGGVSERPKTLGQAVVAQDEKIAKYIADGASGTLSLKVGAAITTADGSGGGLIYREEERTPVPLARRRLLLRNLISNARTSSDLVKYRRQSLRDNQAAAVAEGAAAPESSYGWEKAEAPVRKVSHVTNISEEAMADADQLQSEIDGEMRYGLDLEEDRQILAGDGLGENLAGLLTAAPAFVAAAGLPDATRIDRLRLGLLQVALEDYTSTAIVLNPTDWTAIDLLKDADQRFIFGNPASQSTPMLWGKDVAETNTMTAGEWLAGDLMMAATLYDRMDTEVLISSEHDQNFVEDMLTMKARKRLALAIKRALAMVQGDFTFV